MSAAFISIVVFLLVTSVLTSIVDPPQNEALEYGPGVNLTCEGSHATSRVQWTEYVTNENGAPISDNEVLLPGHPNYDDYHLYHPDDTTYNLGIDPTDLVDGGTYKCQDISDSSAPAYMQLVTLDGKPNITTNIPDTGNVVEDVYYTIEAVINYRGNVAPKMWWTGPGTWNRLDTITNTTVWSGIGFNMTRFMDYNVFEHLTNFTEDGFILPDSATNVPTWNFTWATDLLDVRWGPQKMYYVPEKASYEIGEQIECHADANPSATYFWQNVDTNDFYYDYKFVTTDQMVGTQQFRCNAENIIDGTTYTANLFTNITVNARTTPPTTTTPTTTTPPPAEAPCDDLTGRWYAQTPHVVDMCLEVNNSDHGRVLGIMRNDTDPYFIEIRGKIVPYKYNQLGFCGIWPINIGVGCFTAICNKCHGEESLQVNGVRRRTNDNPACDDHGPNYYTRDYDFRRISNTCRTQKTMDKLLRSMK